MKVTDEQKEYLSFDSELLREEAWDALFQEEGLKELKKDLEDLYEQLKNLGLEHKNPYFAIMLSDGDSIGAWLGKNSSIRKEELNEEFHTEFSKRLSNYAKRVVEEPYPFRQVIYAGGDDLLALLHPHDAIFYARKCAQIFEEQLKSLAKEGGKPSVSAGILVAHAKTNFQMLLEKVRFLESKAKSVKGKGAVCMGFMTRTGDITYFVAKWDHLELYDELFKAFREKALSSRIVYDLRILSEVFNGEKEIDIITPLIKRSFKRHVNDKNNELVQKLSDISLKFIKETLDYWDTSDEEEKMRRSVNNYLNLLYVVRTVGVRIEEV